MKNFWFALLFAAFLLRLVAAFYWNDRVSRIASDVATSEYVSDESANVSQDGPFFFGDSDSYWKLGRALAFGRPYRFDEERRWEIFRTPGYPAILAPIFWIFGENPPVFAARFLGVLFGTTNVALVGLLAFSLFKRRDVAAVAGVFVAFDPTLAFQSVLVLSEEPFLTFALLQYLLALALARRLDLLPDATADFPSDAPPQHSAPISTRTTFRRLALLSTALGATTAATVYLRPSWLYFLPFATFFALIFAFWTNFKNSNRSHFQTKIESQNQTEDVAPSFAFFSRLFALRIGVVVATTALVFAAALFPWTLRNYRIAGRFIPTSLQMGASLYDGLNPNATGASDMRFVDDFRRAETDSPSGATGDHFEVRLDERLKKAALDWARANPSDVLRLAFVKLVRLWSPIPREPAFSAPLLQIILAVSFTPLLFGGICGFFRSLRRRGAAWTALLPAFYVSTLHSIFVSSIRYRVPTLYGFALLTAFFVVSILATRSRSRVSGAKTRIDKKIGPIVSIVGTRPTKRNEKISKNGRITKLALENSPRFYYNK